MHPSGSSLLALTEVPERQTRTRSGLAIEATTQPQGAVLSTFYEGYDKAFVLPNEKEEYDGFVECLTLNAGDAYARLSRLYGAYREIVLVARDPFGAMVGGANFIAFPVTGDRETLAINLNYVFIDQAQRRRGYFKELVASIGEIAAGFFEARAGELPRLVFIEQNDPFQMSPEDYQRDTQHSGIDQRTRIQLWTTLGAKIVDFPYVQPPLSADQLADDTLIYAVLGADGNALDACLLHEHLLRFFGISVLKGIDPRSNAVANAQLAELALGCRSKARIPLLTATNLPAPLPHRTPAETPGRASLREMLRMAS